MDGRGCGQRNRERERDRQTVRQTDRLPDRQTDSQTDRQTKKMRLEILKLLKHHVFQKGRPVEEQFGKCVEQL